MDESTCTRAELVRRAASAERGSLHPIGSAIHAHAVDCKIDTVEATESVTAAGLGLACRVDGEPVRTWSLAKTRRIIASKAGTRVVLGLDRGGLSDLCRA